MPSEAGYSGTPLARKLGIKDEASVVTIGAPKHYNGLLSPVPAGVTFGTTVSARTDIVHVFVMRRSDLALQLAKLVTAIRPDAAIWVSWPKKASKVPTDVTEQTIRDVALPLGLVDIKVCAVDDTWSGLKLVVRKPRR